MTSKEANCEFFGAVDHAMIPGNKQRRLCGECKKKRPNVYSECAKEYYVLVNTEVVLDEHGNTITRFVGEPNMSDTENFEGVEDIVEGPDIESNEVEELTTDCCPIENNGDNGDNEVKGVSGDGCCPAKDDVSEIKIGTAIEPEVPVAKKKRTVVRNDQTVGILDRAKSMLSSGTPYGTVFETLITTYIEIGREPRRAKHNAQSTMFNAMKRLGLKRADNEVGYIKVKN